MGCSSSSAAGAAARTTEDEFDGEEEIHVAMKIKRRYAFRGTPEHSSRRSDIPNGVCSGPTLLRVVGTRLTPAPP